MTPIRDPEGIEAKKLTQYGQLTGKLVLEIGCGYGWLTWQYAGTAREVIGIEPGFPVLQNARSDQPSKVTNVCFAQSMGEHLPFAAGVFDSVVFSNSL